MMPSVEELNRRLGNYDSSYQWGPTLNEGSQWRNNLEDTRYDRDSWAQDLEDIARRYAAVEDSWAQGYPEAKQESFLDYLLRNLKSIDVTGSLNKARDRDWMDIWQSPNQEGYSPEDIQFARQFGQSPQMVSGAQGLAAGSMGMRNVAAKAGPPIMELLSALKAKAMPYAEGLYGGLKETGENIASKVNQAAPQGIMRALQQQEMPSVLNPSVDKVGRKRGADTLQGVWGDLREGGMDIGNSVMDFLTKRGKPLPKRPQENYAQGLANVVKQSDPLDSGTIANLMRELGVETPAEASKQHGRRLAGTFFESPEQARGLIRDPSIWDLGINTPDNPMSRTGRALLNNRTAIPASTILNPLADFAKGAGRESLEALGNYVGTDIQKAIALSGMGGLLYNLLQQPGDRSTFERFTGQR